jgi:hypothetical protein
MKRIRTIRLLVVLVMLGCFVSSTRISLAQDSPAGTPIPDATETVTPETGLTPTSTPEATEPAPAEPTAPAETPAAPATPSATGEALVPAAASPTATTTPSGVVENGDGSYTLTANPGDMVDLDLSPMIPEGGITLGQIISLSATIVSVTGSCSSVGPVFYLNDFSEDAPTQGVTITLGDPDNSFACNTGATGNLIGSGARFFTYHADQSGGPSDGSYGSMLAWLGNTNLPGMKFRLDNEGSSAISITARDFAISVAPVATLNVSVRLCQTSDQAALARQVDYALDPFGPAAVPDCTMLDPTGIPVTTRLLDSNGVAIAALDAETQTDGSLSALPSLASATSMEFSEGLFGTTSDPLAIPYGGGANVGITLYVVGLPGSASLSLVNSITNGGLSGSTFFLYANECAGTPIRTATTDDTGAITFKQLLDGTYCVAQTTPRTGYPAIAPIPPFTINSGQSVVLGPFASDPPQAPLTVHFKDNNNDNAPAPGICAGIYQHSGFPDASPSGELAPIQCDSDNDGSMQYLVAIDVPFEVTVRVLPLGWVVGGSVEGQLSPDDLHGDGGVLTQLVFSGGGGAGEVEIASVFCPVTDPGQARVELGVIDGRVPSATPIQTTGCSPLDATFQVVPYGLDSGYAPITIWTRDGGAVLVLPYTGDVVGGVVPNTLHAFVDNQRPGASGQSVAFEIPGDGVTPAQIAILVYGTEPPPTPEPTLTPTATPAPTGVATLTPVSTAPSSPTPGGTVVALPNTGSGHSAGGSAWLAGLLLMLVGAIGVALAARSRGARRA